jgi:hypothetical protein
MDFCITRTIVDPACSGRWFFLAKDWGHLAYYRFDIVLFSWAAGIQFTGSLQHIIHYFISYSAPMLV